MAQNAWLGLAYAQMEFEFRVRNPPSEEGILMDPTTVPFFVRILQEDHFAQVSHLTHNNPHIMLLTWIIKEYYKPLWGGTPGAAPGYNHQPGARRRQSTWSISCRFSTILDTCQHRSPRERKLAPSHRYVGAAGVGASDIVHIVDVSRTSSSFTNCIINSTNNLNC